MSLCCTVIGWRAWIIILAFRRWLPAWSPLWSRHRWLMLTEPCWIAPCSLSGPDENSCKQTHNISTWLFQILMIIFCLSIGKHLPIVFLKYSISKSLKKILKNKKINKNIITVVVIKFYVLVNKTPRNSSSHQTMRTKAQSTLQHNHKLILWASAEK